MIFYVGSFERTIYYYFRPPGVQLTMKQSLATVRKRQQRILAYFEDEKNLSVTDLSKRLGVSELTIRRDFIYLEGKGLIERYHGGAQKVENLNPGIVNYDIKHTQHLEAKQKIAQAVMEFVQDKDTLFINGGTTTMEVIKLLVDKDITIVTNHVSAFFLFEHGKAKLFSTGGEYHSMTHTYSGPLATSFLYKIVARVCIPGAHGITTQEGITTAYYQETLVNESFINRTNGMVIVVADGSKIGKTFGFNTATIDRVDIIVTDSSADAEEVEKLRTSGVRVLLVEQ